MNKKERKATLIDIAILGDSRVLTKEEEKIDKYDELQREVKRLWNLKQVNVVPIVIGALGTTPKRLQQWINAIDLNVTVGKLQNVALLGTVRILRKVLEH